MATSLVFALTQLTEIKNWSFKQCSCKPFEGDKAPTVCVQAQGSTKTAQSFSVVSSMVSLTSQSTQLCRRMRMPLCETIDASYYKS